MPKKLTVLLSITLGVLIMTCGTYFFLIPPNLAVGGVTGLAVVTNQLFPQFAIGYQILFYNLILLVVSFLVIGKEFGGYTIYCTILYSVLISLFEHLIPLQGPVVSDLWLNLIFGILISGIGMGIIFYHNASTGGTDILAKIINKYLHLQIGKALLSIDIFITLLAIFTFGLELGLYAVLGVLLNATIIDRVILGFNKKLHIVVISSNIPGIRSYILNSLSRGVTVYKAEGGYSQAQQDVLHLIASEREYVRLKKKMPELDPKAFMTVGVVNEVLGEGFGLFK